MNADLGTPISSTGIVLPTEIRSLIWHARPMRRLVIQKPIKGGGMLIKRFYPFN